MDWVTELEDAELDRAVAFHGHFCPGLLIGFRAATIALDRLGVSRSGDEELFGIVENDSCALDGFQCVTGCTMGKGNLIFLDWGKQVFTLAVRPSGRAVRLVFVGDAEKPVNADGETDRDAFARLIYTGKAETLYRIEERTLDLPAHAQRYPNGVCDGCGEAVMQPRLRSTGDKRLCPACLRESPFQGAMTQVADFLFEVGMLKKTPRTGYQFLGNGHESVAAHSFRTAVIAYLLGQLDPNARAERVLKMALFHDLAEARTGDHNYVNKQYVQVDELAAERDATRHIPCKNEVRALLTEFRAQKTLEAQLANDADQLDLVVELKEKLDLGNTYAGAWLYYAEKRLHTETARQLCRTILETDWTHWWFRKEDHLWIRNGEDRDS